MKLKSTITLVMFCLANLTFAQTVYEEIVRNPFLSANNYCVYPDSDTYQYTPAPAGKKPFYISHYGRHGSRYLSKEYAYDIPYNALNKADSLGKLTSIGKEALHEIGIAREDIQGRYGELTALGNRQHRHIIRRMMEHYPEVFEGDVQIDAKSTTKIRCILSMGAAIQQMLTINPALQVRTDASQHDMWYMNFQDKKLRDNRMPPAATTAYQEYCKKLEDNERLMATLFNDTAYVRQHVDDEELSYYLFKVASIQQNTHLRDSLHLIRLFSNEELYNIWNKENSWWYINYGPSLLNGGKQPYTQRNLLRKIIEEADSCIALPKPGATLRFGHDTMVLPLSCLLDLNGYGYQTMDLGELEEHGWIAYRAFPMAANLQFVFYRNNPSDKDVIFKILLNEKEATLPLQTDIAPYYHWDDFRDYYLKLLDAYESN